MTSIQNNNNRSGNEVNMVLRRAISTLKNKSLRECVEICAESKAEKRRRMLQGVTLYLRYQYNASAARYLSRGFRVFSCGLRYRATTDKADMQRKDKKEYLVGKVRITLIPDSDCNKANVSSTYNAYMQYIRVRYNDDADSIRSEINALHCDKLSKKLKYGTSGRKAASDYDKTITKLVRLGCTEEEATAIASRQYPNHK